MTHEQFTGTSPLVCANLNVTHRQIEVKPRNLLDKVLPGKTEEETSKLIETKSQ